MPAVRLYGGDCLSVLRGVGSGALFGAGIFQITNHLLDFRMVPIMHTRIAAQMRKTGLKDTRTGCISIWVRQRLRMEVILPALAEDARTGVSALRWVNLEGWDPLAFSGCGRRAGEGRQIEAISSSFKFEVEVMNAEIVEGFVGADFLIAFLAQFVCFLSFHGEIEG